MISTSRTSVNPLRFSSLDWVHHGISTRHGGVSDRPYHSLNIGLSTADDAENVSTNRRLFFDALGISQATVIPAWLSHGSEVAVFQANRPDAWPVRRSAGGGQGFAADAVVSNVPGLHFLFTFADCVPLIIADRALGVVGAAHAGWRGTAAGIAGALVRNMEEAFGSRPSDLTAVIGPSIGPCCYAVGQDVLADFRGRGQPAQSDHRDGRLYLDLWETNRQQFLSWGVSAGSIEVAACCTSCNVGTFFSHRAENGVTGRFGLCVGL